MAMAVAWCFQVESELKDLEAAEAAEYLASLGVQEGGLSSLIRSTYRQLGLQTYFTTGMLQFVILGGSCLRESICSSSAVS